MWTWASWGAADLDVAHCSTALALLHGPDEGMRFADRYAAEGGRLSLDPADHLYWRMLDALAFAPDAEKVAVPWRESGRTDLTDRPAAHPPPRGLPRGPAPPLRLRLPDGRESFAPRPAAHRAVTT
ncbi:hypothetical protein GCM10010381_44200 [Streptomyces xantholiticus]|nr:hypothetical protein GCM10010381_44200 [Streptomyces xantholiticus]